MGTADAPTAALAAGGTCVGGSACGCNGTYGGGMYGDLAASVGAVGPTEAGVLGVRWAGRAAVAAGPAGLL